MLVRLIRAGAMPAAVVLAIILAETFAIAILLPKSAGAHETAPSEIFLELGDDRSLSVQIRLDRGGSHQNGFEPVAPATAEAPDHIGRIAQNVRRTFLVRADNDLIDLTAPRIEALSGEKLTIALSGQLPETASDLTVLPGPVVGDSIIRFTQNGKETLSRFAPGPEGVSQSLSSPATGWMMASVAADYVHAGFIHIVPRGLDHILFVVGLFLLSLKMRPLLIQVSLFTAAHTMTLALGATGLIVVPAAVVEPLIAASIVFIAVENIVTNDLSRWRPFVVFAFGLLHGLGFAGVIADFGLPTEYFFTALIAFNIGVELGQLFVLALCFAVVGLWFSHKAWYRKAITVPASALVAATGLFWTVQRVGEVL